MRIATAQISFEVGNANDEEETKSFLEDELIITDLSNPTVVSIEIGEVL